MELFIESKIYLYLIGAAILFIVGLINIQIKDRYLPANILFTVLLFRFSIGCIAIFFYHTQYYKLFPEVKLFSEALRVTSGPLSYLYIKALITFRYRFTKKELIHFIPLLITLLSIIPLYFIYSDNIAEFIVKYENFEHPISLPYFIVRMVQPAIYMYFSWKILKKHSRNIMQNYSSCIDQRSLAWVRRFIFLYCSVILCYLLLTFSLKYYFPEIQHLADDFTNSIIFFFFMTFIFFGIIQVNIYQDVEDFQFDASDEAAVAWTDEDEKYTKSKLPPEKADEYLNIILKYMEEKKAYLDNDITLQKLSKHLSIPSNYISQVLNNCLGKNYYDFINSYRLNEAKIKLSDPLKSESSIMEILLESGFNSKSVFNDFFKKQIGMTPSQFRKKMSSQIG